MLPVFGGGWYSVKGEAAWHHNSMKLCIERKDFDLCWFSVWKCWEGTLVFLTCLPGSHYSYNSGPSRHHSKLRIKLNLQNSNVFSFLLARTKCLNYATWGRTKEGRVRSQRTIIFTKILPRFYRVVGELYICTIPKINPSFPPSGPSLRG